MWACIRISLVPSHSVWQLRITATLLVKCLIKVVLRAPDFRRSTRMQSTRDVIGSVILVSELVLVYLLIMAYIDKRQHHFTNKSKAGMRLARENPHKAVI